MHMHVLYWREVRMRTTIEIKDEHRAKLLEIAAQRGEKGFSKVVEEALEVFIQTQIKNDELRRRALRLRGAINQKEAKELRERTQALRENWRCS